MPGWFNDLITSTYFASILFGLGAINLAKNPDGLFALVGQPAAREAAAQEARGARRRWPRSTLARGRRHVPDERVGPPVRATTAMHVPGGRRRRRRCGRRRPAGGDRRRRARARRRRRRLRRRRGAARRRPSHVEPGEVVALLGANGAGKSTLCARRRGPARADEGTVLARRARRHRRERRSSARARACCSCPRRAASSRA